MSQAPPAICILLADLQRATRLTQVLAQHGMEAAAIETSEALHRQLTSQHVDLLVIQQQLDGFLKGLDIVERLATNLIRPDVVLVADLSPIQQETAERLKIGSVVPENADLARLSADVLARAALLLAPRSAIPLRARQLAAGVDVIRPLPQLLTKLWSYLKEETGSLTELARDISVDPRVTAELLKVTNSATSGLSKKVTSIQDAVLLLGLKRTISTVLATGVLKTQHELLRTLPAEIRAWYQKRTVLMASTAAQFAERIEKLSGETAHILGLFQDLGILVLANAESRGYLQTIQRVRTMGHARLDGLERSEYLVTHAEVSAALLEKWEVPQSFVAMVLNHHTPEWNDRHSDVERQYLRVMRIAEAVANLGDVCTPYRQRALACPLAEYGPDRADECKSCITLAVAKAAEYGKLFSVPEADETILHRLLGEAGQEEPAVELEPVESIAAPKFLTAPAAVHAAHRSAAPASFTSTERPRILVIDDEEVVIQMMSYMLKSEGYEVVGCSAATVDAIPTDVDLIFCDLHLGEISGTDLIVQLQARGVAVPVIMISADRKRDSILECIQAGIADYLVKPFSRQTMLEKLRKHLGPRSLTVAGATAR